MYEKLLNLLNNSYCPYSNFKVGAAILFEDGKIYTGSNVENASFGATNCAERTAIFKGVHEGNREIKAVAVVGDTNAYTYPCGICRQVMSEFCNPETFQIILVKSIKEYKVYTLKELLPKGFGPAQLL